MVLGFVLFLLPSGCVTTIDHATVVPPQKKYVLIATKFQVLLPRTCVCQEVNEGKKLKILNRQVMLPNQMEKFTGHLEI